jgi:excinuclease ABC subunit B
MAYNQAHGITPQALHKAKSSNFGQLEGKSGNLSKAYIEKTEVQVAADPVVQFMNPEQLTKAILTARKNMEKAAREMDFIDAAKFRDELFALEKLLEEKKQN